MNKFDLKILLEKYEKGDCTQKEQLYLHTFFESFVASNDEWSGFSDSEKERIKKEIFQATEKKIFEQQSKSNKSSLVKYLALAASVVLIVGALFIFQNSNQFELSTVDKIVYKISQTKIGEKQNVFLPDGTKVYLNYQSKIEYPLNFEENRVVKLTGEAFFDVKRDTLHPFVILSGGIKTTVLGTSFNVSSYSSNNIDVTVVSGKVSVSRDEQKVVLTKGQQAIYHSKTDKIIEKRNVDLDKYVSWKEGIIKFDDNSLSEVFSTLEKWYGVTFLFDKTLNESCSLKLSFDNLSLEDVLEQLKFVTSINYEFVNEKQVKIEGVGCL